jgi:hypothetical protein
LIVVLIFQRELNKLCHPKTGFQAAIYSEKAILATETFIVEKTLFKESFSGYFD